MKKYTGSCQCGAVTFEAELGLENLITCNCSHCSRKGLILEFIDKDKFKITKGEDNLTEYLFNKKAIRHLFCKTCGVQGFAEGVTFPKAAINVRCVDGIDISTLNPVPYNGRDV